ncbi:hypothetical protein apy_07520 [Aeropyrum pernix]|uniref:Uncharacterized protein n=1 Tax=Aeropyrum pernix TaxID=56636 RepID=A0A401H9C9_AERPX|nr:hypothetical protein [Aeropyrum pernix]GBF09027.1 hypothetical protein apy_07520 [Aeropyrum pernix]
MAGAEIVRLAIPFHVFVTKKGQGGLGVDASLWRAVEADFRRSLLVVPASRLTKNKSGDCFLKPKASPEEVIEGLRDIARSRPSPYRVFRAKLAALINPFYRSELDRAGREYVEALRAATLASAILELEIGEYQGMMWGGVSLEIEKTSGGRSYRLVEAPSPGYRGLVEHDRGVRRVLGEAVRVCYGKAGTGSHV